jgi:hypothetical protein
MTRKCIALGCRDPRMMVAGNESIGCEVHMGGLPPDLWSRLHTEHDERLLALSSLARALWAAEFVKLHPGAEVEARGLRAMADLWRQEAINAGHGDPFEGLTLG